MCYQATHHKNTSSLAKDRKISTASLPGIGPTKQGRAAPQVLRSLVHVLTDGAVPFQEAGGMFNFIKANLKMFMSATKVMHPRTRGQFKKAHLFHK